MAKIVKLPTERQQTINRLSSELQDLLYEYPGFSAIVFETFYKSLYAAKVDSTIIVDVLSKYDDEVAKEIVMTIKVTEGW